MRAKVGYNYTAYGLKIAGISSKKLGDVNEGYLQNQYQYQGDYSEFDDETQWNDFALRNYDAQTGRFIQADPYNQFPSPYTGMANDPINTIDPSGGIGIDFGTIGQITGSVLADRALITTAGAAIGFGIDKLTGGNGWTGAAIGGGVALGGTFIPPFDIANIFKGAGKSALIQGADIAANVAMRHVAAEIPNISRDLTLSATTLSPHSPPSVNIVAPKTSQPSVPPPSAPWMTTARHELGVSERTGNNDGPQVERYLRTVGLGGGYAWCAAFVNWTLGQNDIRGTGRGNALSYLTYGQRLPGPAYGSIAVLNHGKGLGHVGFVAGQSPNGSIILLGGNQSNMVKYSSFPRSSISGYVYPNGYTPSYELPTITNTSTSSFSQTR